MFFCVEKLFLSGNRDLFDTYLSIYLYIYNMYQKDPCFQTATADQHKKTL